MENQFRFGVFLRPEPKTCAAVTTDHHLAASGAGSSQKGVPTQYHPGESLLVVGLAVELMQLIGFACASLPGLHCAQSWRWRCQIPQSLVTCQTVQARRPALNVLASSVDSVVQPLSAQWHAAARTCTSFRIA